MMDAQTLRGAEPRPRRTQPVLVAVAAALGLAMLPVGLAPGTVHAQDPGASASATTQTLVGRLPARIADTPVQVDLTNDLGSWIDEGYPGETHPEFEALDAALAAQGLARADIPMVWASAHDYDISITGLQLPEGDAQSIRDAVLGVYFLGFEGLVNTEQEVDGHPVTIVSQGPLDDDGYPFGVVTDRDTVWIASAEPDLLRQAMGALVGAATGTVPRYDASASPDIGFVAPWSWEGTTSQTITWDKGSYQGTAMGRLTGTWVQPASMVRHCEFDDCTAYIPSGTIEWSWDVSAPTRPSCSASTRGSLDPGKVVIPSDQMLFLDPTDDGHARFWGSGTFQVPEQPCVGWEGSQGPGSFFSIPTPEDPDPYADESNDQYPSCGNRQWRITAQDTRITGRCWNYHEPGYEDVVEWDLVAYDQ